MNTYFLCLVSTGVNYLLLPCVLSHKKLKFWGFYCQFVGMDNEIINLRDNGKNLKIHYLIK